MDAEQRRGNRIEVGGPATLGFDGASWSGYIENVSHRGVFFASQSPVPKVGCTVKLAVEGQKPVLAEIAWVGERGCGLRILGPV